MINIDNLTYTYPNAQQPALADLSLSIAEGEFVLLAGESGSGKSTLLRALNGLVPHFYGGRVAGRVRVAGHDPIAEGPGDMSAVVGFVFQDPESQVVADIVEDELAFAMENAGLTQATMRKRIEEVVAQLDIAHLRGRRISTLSGGERQRVAIAAVLTLEPQVLALDEPTSQLDPQAADEVLDTLVKLNHDLGLTIVLSEQRLERVVQHVDQMIYLPRQEQGQPTRPTIGPPAEVLNKIPLAPPLAQVAQALGWKSIPLTIKQARRLLASDPRFAALDTNRKVAANDGLKQVHNGDQSVDSETLVQARDLWYSYGRREALRGLNLNVRRGEILALMGRNGAGKTTLLKLIVGLLKPSAGRIITCGLDTSRAPLEQLVRQVAYLPQRPDSMLFADTVEEEIAFTRRNHALAVDDAETTELLRDLNLLEYRQRDPKDVSVGERQRIALAATLAANPQLLLLDEPTRGMDYRQKDDLADLLRELAKRGKAIILATHDVEMAAGLAHRIALLAEGQIVVEGPAREVMSDSLVFSSQVSKLFRDPALITVADVKQLVR